LPYIEIKGGVPVTANDEALVDQLTSRWRREFGEDMLVQYERQGMGGEDFPFFTQAPYIPSVYFSVGGTPKENFVREAQGGVAVPSHHSPLFEISPEPAVVSGVMATVSALRELMPVD
jgi:hippurate hydrolase